MVTYRSNKDSVTIEDHAVIGDLQTVALVSTSGSMDFLCLPALDGPTIFASLLDADAGTFSIELSGALQRRRQHYLPDTAVVVTQFATSDALVELTDFMVVGLPKNETAIVRIVEVLRGNVELTLTCDPKFNYARTGHTTAPTEGGVEFCPDDENALTLQLLTDVPLVIDAGSARAQCRLEHGEAHAFVFGRSASLPQRGADVEKYARAQLTATMAFWQAWCARSTYRGRWRETVMRSALTLKLLVSNRYGSIAAAATFGLPEAIPGDRNWDYRYSWVRDASFAVYAFIRLGYIDEALAFMHWIGSILTNASGAPTIKPMYRLDGSSDIPAEETLAHIAGYGGAQPVRIGNAARSQLQLDVYGALMDAVYLTSKYGGAVPLDAWATVCGLIAYVGDYWREPDEGIWEVRSGRERLLHSRIMYWVAVDRAIRLSEKRSLPAPIGQWNDLRNAIYQSVIDEFWNDEIEAFVQSKGSRIVDASALMMPLVRFIGGRDPRWQKTQARIEAELVEDVRVYRYSPSQYADGLSGTEGAFSTCSFWLVECIVRGGDTARARLMFEKLLLYGNHVGLYAEEFGPLGDQLGNFPQALTHLSLISAAFALDNALSGDRPTPWR